MKRGASAQAGPAFIQSPTGLSAGALKITKTEGKFISYFKKELTVLNDEGLLFRNDEEYLMN